MNLIKRLSRDNGNDLVTGPLAPFASLQRQFDRLLTDTWDDMLVGNTPRLRDFPTWPAIDVSEDDKVLTLKADIPGLDTKDVDVEVADKTLTIRGQREQEHDETKRGRRYYERQFGSFSRSFTLPDYVDGNKVEAKYDKGVLTITLPKVAGQSPKKVTVKPATT